MRNIFLGLSLSVALGLAASMGMAADLAAGKMRSAQCAACHGSNGHAVVPETPNLAGQDEDYLFAQLKAFRSGERKNETMSVIAKPLTDAEIANLVAYYHSLK
ncbi:Cytochrome c553 [Burkholderia sp. OK233]|nr:Cytochrome c553 [Burkholderia sp. OK233]